MKFSESWLREFVDPDLTTQELVDQLTMAGLEVDAIEPVASDFSKVVVGEILAVSPHPDADKLVVCEVSSGDETHQVVCGAPNARTGIKIPFALVGAHLEDFKIKKAKLRGVESFGMLCSEKELGLSDNHDGLMELPAEAPVGIDVSDYLKLKDSIIDLDLTPNRSDCLGMLGLARETGVINELDVHELHIPHVKAESKDTFPVTLSVPEACPVFAGRVIKGINLVAKTPLWMKEKLRRAGLRSIDPVVDVTNYVMLELGQPMHAYDLSKLLGKIDVRLSESGEKITLLDGKEVELEADTLLITDQSGPIGMAGIMGGLSTSVTKNTQDIYLESAFFNPTAIAGRARTYGMSTDAAHRFERGVDWEGQARAIERATALLTEIAGGVPGPVEETKSTAHLPEKPRITLRLERVIKLLGVEIEGRRVESMLKRLGFSYHSMDAGVWVVIPPSSRFDIAIEADLIEEISRIYGYNNLPVRTPKTYLDMRPVTEYTTPIGQLKQKLVDRGYQEAISYSFVDTGLQEALDPENDPIGLANPISSEMGVMRTSLWPGLVKALIHNQNRQQIRVRLFETGLRFRQPPNSGSLVMENISQLATLSMLAAGSRSSENWANSSEVIDFYDVKGDLESMISGLEFRKGQHPALHSGQSAEVFKSGQSIGYMGMIDPRVQKTLGIEGKVFLVELLLSAVMDCELPRAEALSRFPEVRRDIAIIVDQDVLATDITKCIESQAGESFKNLKLFDVYQGKGIDPNRKSLALGLTFQHASRTLTDEDISASVDQVVAALASQYGAKLRN